MVLGAVMLTALAVSAVSLRTTYVLLERQLERRLPAEAEALAEELASWIETGSADAHKAWRNGGPEAFARLEETRFFVAAEPLADLPTSGSWQGLDPSTSGIQWVGLPARGVFFVIGDAEAGWAARFDPEVVARKIRRAEAGRASRFELRGAGAAVEPLAGGPLAVRERRGVGTSIGSAVAVPGTPLELVVETPFEVAFEPVLSALTRLIAIDTLILLLFGSVAYRLTLRIARPLEALSDGARRVAQGQLDVELPDAGGHDEIGLLTRSFNEMIGALRVQHTDIEAAQGQLRHQNDELIRANEVLEQLSITDGLTKLHNHRFFQDQLTREIKRCSRTEAPLSMLMIDIDDFKGLNDRRGHAAGDEVLARLAQVLAESVRATDLLARYGGEEFVVLTPGTPLDTATRLAEKLRFAVAQTSLLLDRSLQIHHVTVSIGVAEFAGSRHEFFQNADQALYRAKAAGKDCVVPHEEPPSPGEPEPDAEV